MAQANQKISPLRQRMIEDMRMRQLSPSSQRNYIHAVFEFTRFFCQSPDKGTAQDIRRYLLHMEDNGSVFYTTSAGILPDFSSQALFTAFISCSNSGAK